MPCHVSIPIMPDLALPPSPVPASAPSHAAAAALTAAAALLPACMPLPRLLPQGVLPGGRTQPGGGRGAAGAGEQRTFRRALRHQPPGRCGGSHDCAAPPPATQPPAAAAAAGTAEAADAGPVRVLRCPATFQLAENPAGLWACRCCGRRYRPEALLEEAVEGSAATADHSAAAAPAPAAAAEQSIGPQGGGGGGPGSGPTRAPPACLLCGVAFWPRRPSAAPVPSLLRVAWTLHPRTPAAIHPCAAPLPSVTRVPCAHPCSKAGQFAFRRFEDGNDK